MRRRSFLTLSVSLALGPVRRAAPAAQTPVVPEGHSALMTLLRLVPNDALGETGILYANYAAQLEARGIVGGGSGLDQDAWLAAIGRSMMTPRAMEDSMSPVWREGLGFDLRDVGAMVEVGPSDTDVLILSGRFDAVALRTAWETGGYAPTETDGVTWYTLGADNVLFDPDVPLSNFHLGMLSHLALIDGDTVIGTAQRAGMERALALLAGKGKSFGGGAGAALAGTSDDLASGWMIAGTVLVAPNIGMMTNNPNVPTDVQARLATQAAQTTEEAPRMPPIALALVGNTAGGVGANVPHPHAVAVMVPADPADAAMAAETATRRLTTESLLGGDSVSGESLLGRPWTDAFTDMSVETTADGAVVIDLTPAEDVPAELLFILAQGRNLSVLYWAD